MRTKARALLVDMNRGVSATTKRADRAAESAQTQRQELTLHAAVTAYIDSTERAPATTAGYAALLKNHLAAWHNKRLVDISPTMVVDLHQAIGGIAANNAMRLFRSTWNANRRILSLPESPTYILSSRKKSDPHCWTTETRRDRRIHPAELRAWWAATGALTTGR